MEASAPKIRYFPLQVTGKATLLWHKDEGIALDEDGLHFRKMSFRYSRKFVEIVEVNLSLLSLPKGPDRRRTKIKFSDGLVISVTDGWAAGWEVHQLYNDFNEQLHAHLVETGVDRTTQFTIGFRPRLASFAAVLFTLSIGIFTLWPVVIALQHGGHNAVGAVMAGIACTWAIGRTALRNRPGTYNPRDVPDLSD